MFTVGLGLLSVVSLLLYVPIITLVCFGVYGTRREGHAAKGQWISGVISVLVLLSMGGASMWGALCVMGKWGEAIASV